MCSIGILHIKIFILLKKISGTFIIYRITDHLFIGGYVCSRISLFLPACFFAVKLLKICCCDFIFISEDVTSDTDSRQKHSHNRKNQNKSNYQNCS